ncbi:MAG: ROK family protein [Patescibacteria group bacterium]
MAELFLGIDLGGSHISAQLLSRDGKNHSPFFKIDIGSDLNIGYLLNYLTSFVRSARLAALNQGGRLVAVGLASPGPLEPNVGIIISPPNLPGIKNFEVVRALQNVVGLQVFLINDADAAVLGEAWLGSAQGFKNVIMLTLGTGIGSGIIANGKLQRGRGMGGEWGHTTIFFGDQRRLCSCKRWNCLEAFCGTEGLFKTYSRFFSSQTCQEVSKKMIENWKSDHAWEKVFGIYCRCLTEGIINIANVHHPECIVLGGGIAHSDIVEKVKESLRTPANLCPNPPWTPYKLKILLRGLEIRLAILEHSGIIGAAKHAMDSHSIQIERPEVGC